MGPRMRPLRGAVGTMTRVAALILSAVIGTGIGAGAVVVTETEPAPVCHAPSEDSVMTDCTYSHGAWRPIAKDDR